MSFNHTDRRSLTHSQRPSLVYIFARDYDTAAKVAAAERLGRIRWQYIASKYSIIGRAYIRIWTCPDDLSEHPQYRSVAAEIARLRAEDKVVEDKTIPAPKTQ